MFSPLPFRKISLPTRILMILVALAFLPTSPLMAVDILPQSTNDARAVGKVSTARTADKGSLVTGFQITGADAVLHDDGVFEDVGLDGDVDETVRDYTRASVFLGWALTNRLEFSLGLHGTNEIVSAETRDRLFAEEDPQVDDDWQENTKETGFSGASLFAKIGLLDRGTFQLAVAPMVESGVGENGTFALTRSVRPKAGWMVMATYGNEGVAEININAGYRYRDAESIGAISLRNESFVQAALQASLSRSFAVMLGGQGRRLMIARESDRDSDGGFDYKPQDAGELHGGFVARLGEARLTAFYGSKVKKSAGFGFGNESFGMSVSYELGNTHRRKPRAGFAKEIAERQAKKVDKKGEDASSSKKNSTGSVAQKNVASQKPAAGEKVAGQTQNAKTAGDPYPEMIGRDIDPLSILEDDKEIDVFEAADVEAAKAAKDTSKSADQIVTEELTQLREADAKVEAERKRIAEKEAAESRRNASEQAEEEAELMKEWLEEANTELDSDPGITDDELNWQGLEQ